MTTDEKVVGWSMTAEAKVVVPSTDAGAAGSAITRKKSSQPSAAPKPAYPSSPIASSGVPWKQK